MRSPPTAWSTRFTRWSITAFCILLGSVAVVVCKPLTVQYHLWGKRYYSNPFSTGYRHHLEALEKLGHYEKHRFPLKHISVPSPEADRLYAKLRRLPVQDRVLSMGTHEPTEPDYIIVWTSKDQLVHFKTTIETMDIPAEPK